LFLKEEWVLIRAIFYWLIWSQEIRFLTSLKFGEIISVLYNPSILILSFFISLIQVPLLWYQEKRPDNGEKEAKVERKREKLG